MKNHNIIVNNINKQKLTHIIIEKEYSVDIKVCGATS